MKKIFGILVLALCIYSCGDDETVSTDDGMQPEGSFDRGAMLAHWADAIIVPGYEDFTSKVNTLESETASFLEDADRLEDVREAWLDAYKSWQRVSMFEIGPAETINLRLNLNIYPATIATIENNIASSNYNLELSSNRSAKGFPAIEYLLYGVAQDDEDIKSLFSDEDDSAYSDYLTAIVADMKTRATTVLNEWKSGYRDTFVANDGASATASTDRFVNDYIFYFEKHLRAGKMGIPGGVFSGTVAPNTLEGVYAGDISQELFLIGLDATQDFFNGVPYNGGAGRESLSSYLDKLDAVKGGSDLSNLINVQFDTARASVQSLNAFDQELEVNPPVNFLNAYNDVQRLVPLLKVDMVSAMSISIDFADADGD